MKHQKIPNFNFAAKGKVKNDKEKFPSTENSAELSINKKGLNYQKPQFKEGLEKISRNNPKKSLPVKRNPTPSRSSKDIPKNESQKIDLKNESDSLQKTLFRRKNSETSEKSSDEETGSSTEEDAKSSKKGVKKKGLKKLTSNEIMKIHKSWSHANYQKLAALIKKTERFTAKRKKKKGEG